MERDTIITINKIISKAQNKVQEILEKEYPNLSFYISPEGYLSFWIKIDGTGVIGVQSKYKINVGQILPHQAKYLDELHEQITQVTENYKEYFYCTECGQVLPRSEYADNVFAGYYCKKCAEIPSVKNLIEESKTRGFYD